MPSLSARGYLAKADWKRRCLPPTSGRGSANSPGGLSRSRRVFPQDYMMGASGVCSLESAKHSRVMLIAGTGSSAFNRLCGRKGPYAGGLCWHLATCRQDLGSLPMARSSALLEKKFPDPNQSGSRVHHARVTQPRAPDAEVSTHTLGELHFN